MRRASARPVYGKVARGQAAAARAAEGNQLKDPKDWKIAGKPLKRLEYGEQRSTASQIYGADLPCRQCSTPR